MNRRSFIGATLAVLTLGRQMLAKADARKDRLRTLVAKYRNGPRGECTGCGAKVYTMHSPDCPVMAAMPASRSAQERHHAAVKVAGCLFPNPKSQPRQTLTTFGERLWTDGLPPSP